MEHDNTVEIINECIILCLFYLGLILQQVSYDDPILRYNIGYAGMALVSLCLLGNAIYFVKGIINQIKASFNKWRASKQRKLPQYEIE